jgi:hypothetical protein
MLFESTVFTPTDEFRLGEEWWNMNKDVGSCVENISIEKDEPLSPLLIAVSIAAKRLEVAF